MTMQKVYADLHIHIGRTNAGQPVKITAARDLTFENIAKECAVRKGIELAGVVDCGSPAVMQDIDALVETGEMVELPEGGLRYRGSTVVILGCELETVEEDGSPSHHVSYFPGRQQLRVFVGFLRRLVTNLDLSSQRCRVPARQLLRMARTAGGIFVPAHAFTPHRSPYGACVARLRDMFGEDGLAQLAAVELGLSADSYLADRIAELAPLTLLSNSDAHSLPKIAREYNALWLEGVSFQEVVWALRRERGRKVLANYGLDPRLGKYHRTFCPECEAIAPIEPPVLSCPLCGGSNVVKGVLDRIAEIADYPEPRPPSHRPPYHYQVPLQFLPGVGAVALGKLLNRFGTEMHILHEAKPEELELVVGQKLAKRVIQARQGSLPLLAGGGGRYGKAVADESETQLTMGL
jgi:uncharacterized protein (TIGR00375 family)